MSDLEFKYWGSFIGACAIVIVLQIMSRNGSNEQKTQTLASNAKFVTFQRTYLTIFLLAMFADWLQGPYVYELYVSYGFNQIEIAQLFVCGFGSSMVFGTFVGGMADKYGRKVMCLLYCVCYIIACFTKLVNSYSILMVGRFLSGIATSLLFSAFESWMVCEHHKQGFDASLLGDTFSYATFGNGVVAVLAGLVANFAADNYGYVAPFVVALFPLFAVAGLAFFSWNENYGNQSTPMMTSLITGFHLVRSDPKIAALGMAQSCFEGAMYTFVFMWTPALKTAQEAAAEAAGTAPVQGVETTADFLGLIFAVYMICVMIGSTLFKMLSFSKENLYRLPLGMHAVACVAMFITSMTVGQAPTVVYAMFLLFETCVGVFYPAYGCIKSEKIPEEIRAAVMNIFRIPLNLFVLLLLLKIKHFSSDRVFMICAVAHAVSLVCYAYFYMASKESYPNDYSAVPTRDQGKASPKPRSYVRSTSEYELHMREQGDDNI